MANHGEIDRDAEYEDTASPEAPREAEPAQGVSSFLSLRTLAAGMAGAVIAALVLGAVVLFLRSDDNAPIQVLLPSPTQAGNPGSAVNASQELKVYVTGAVANPGVYSLPPGGRISDAIDAAGGATTDAQMEAVNLALRVRDEGHYHMPRLGETPLANSTTVSQSNQGAGSAAAGICDGLVDLNSASAELLESLPNIGQVRAAAVVSYREENGGFPSVEDITAVSGIGPATYEAIRELATVCDPG